MPLAIQNNRSGADAQVLARYGEPAWNNPVVRYFGHEGGELLPRGDRDWSEHRFATRMIAALEAARVAAPAWLALVAEETDGAELERAVLAMPCFWRGEAALGGIEGVRSARAGFAQGREVVELAFDPGRISFEELGRRATGLGCADRAWSGEEPRVSAAPASDQRYHLQRSPFAFVPLSPLQSLRVNSALEAGRDARALLSPRQQALLARIARTLDEDRRALEGREAPADLFERPERRDEVVRTLREAARPER